VLALALAAGLARTRIPTFSWLVALVVPSPLVVIFHWAGVSVVNDVSRIPRGIPVPSIPDLSLLTPALLASAVSVAAVIAVHGVGVSQSVENPDGTRTVTVLEVAGSLFFAGARTLGEALPSPAGATRPVVVLRLRDRTRVGATLIEVLDAYADDLAQVGGRLYLSGVDARLAAQLRRVGKLDLDRTVHVAPAQSVYGASTAEAVAQASAWLGTSATAGDSSDDRS
jgi:MFS superfamily sulfate permease-like transporter